MHVSPVVARSTLPERLVKVVKVRWIRAVQVPVPFASIAGATQPVEPGQNAGTFLNPIMASMGRLYIFYLCMYHRYQPFM